MTNVMLGWTNHIDTSTLAATSEASGLSVSNLQSDQGSPSTAWQTAAGVTSATLTIDTGDSTSTWRAFLLARTNLTGTATVRWLVSDDPTFATAALASGTIAAGVVAGVGQSLYIPTFTPAGRYARCDITDTANPDGFLSVALAYTGPVWQPATNISPATTRGRDDSTAETVTRGGQEFPVVAWRRRRWNLDFAGIRTDEVQPYIDALDYKARAGGNVLVVPDPSSTALNQEAVFGRLKPRADIGYFQGSPDRRTWRATITERL